ncbi:MAG: FumA C-terminus/TtdB family hydratase beta subunit [Candidatus Omnitrophota bacterium]
MKKIRVTSPVPKNVLAALKAGDQVLLSGTIFTARDAVHKLLVERINKRKALPLPLKGISIYYAGPTPAPKGMPIGACGPTTSSRVDAFTPELLKAGVAALIGKGTRSDDVRRAIKRYGAVYFLAIGGAGAFISATIKSSKVVAYKELGPEAVHRLEVRDMPLIVGIDAGGKDIYGKRR